MREQILELLERNSRMTPAEIAVLLGSGEEVIASEIKKMEEENIICGYNTLIDWDKTAADKITALIEVRVTPTRGQGFDKIAERIYRYDEVESVYLMSGGFDLTVIIEGKSMREVANFVAQKLAPMEAVLSTGTHFVLKKYKEHGLPLVSEGEGDERMLVTP